FICKNWMHARRNLYICLAVFALATAILVPAASAGVSVLAPVASAVNSPFLLRAQATSCNSQPTASMAYSLDPGSDTVLSGATLIDTTVSTTSGGHTLRVKAWGNSGAFCETDVALTVGGGVVVSTPSNGATVSSPFNLQAQATTCGAQSTASMAY